MHTKLRALSAGVIEAAALLTVAVVPVFVNFYSFRVFEPDKHAVFLALVTLAGLAGLVALVEGRLAGLRQAIRQPLVAAALLLGATWVVSTAASIAPGVSLYGSNERAQGLIALLAALLLFAGVGWVARDEARRRRLVAAMLLASAPVAALAIVQALNIEVVAGLVESKERVFGTLSNPIFLGAYLMLVAPFTFARILAAWRARRHGLSAALALLGLLQLVALFLSDSRGPILGLAVGLWVMAVAGAAVSGRWHLAWGVVVLAVVGAVFLVVFNLPASPLEPLRDVRFIGRFGRIADTSVGSEAARVRIWGAVDRLLAGEKQRLAVGHGPETLKYALLPFSEANLPGRAQADRLVDRAHNGLLDALVMTGLPGALALLLVYGAWLLTAASALGLTPEPRHRRWLAGLLALGTVAGAASWLVAPIYAGALTLLGMAAGLGLYLVIALWQGRATEEPVDLTALALFGIGAAAVVEAAFGIQTVVTQAVFWLTAGLLVARAAAGRGELGAAATTGRAPGRTVASAAAAPGQVTVTWSPGGAALGLALGAILSSLVYSFFLFGTERLPDTVPIMVLVALVTLLAGAVLAADARASAATCLVTGLVVLILYAALRVAVLGISADAAVLFAATVWWLVVLALLGGYWLRAATWREPLWLWPVGLVYPLFAILAVVFVFVRAVRPVQADVYFQSASANLTAALATDDQRRFAVGETLFERAVTISPKEPIYPMKWAEYYTRVGAGILAGPQPDIQAAALAFNRAQDLLLKAEELEPLMPYHTFNRGHLQLVFAQGLPANQSSPLRRQDVAANAADAFAEASRVLKNDPQVVNEYALARLLEDKPDEAAALLEYSLTVDPAKVDTYPLLGRAYMASGQPDRAQQILEQAVARGVGGAEVLVALGEVAREKGETFTALNYYQQAADEEPGNWALLFNLGLLYGEAGDDIQAVDVLMQAMSIAPPVERDRIQTAVDEMLTSQKEEPTP